MLFYFACEAAGASAPGIPHALLMERRKDQCTTRAHSRRENADTRDPHSVIAREGGRSSIAEEPVINRQAAAYWIPAFAGMTIGRGLQKRPFAYASAGECHAPCHRPRKAGDPVFGEELMINRQAAAYWIPAFAGMTAGPTTNATCLRMRAQRSDPAFCLASRWIASLRSRVTVETVCRDATHHPSSPRTRGPITIRE